MANPTLLAGAISGFLAVALGAFAAHGLQSWLPAASLKIFQTGAHYQLAHALLLVAIGVLREKAAQSPWLRLAGWSLGLGIVLFSGSLYLLALTQIRGFAALTPVGGVLFLTGWCALGIAAVRGGKASTPGKGGK